MSIVARTDPWTLSRRREPWSIPTSVECWHVAIGLILGVAIAATVMLVGLGPGNVLLLLSLLLALGYCGWMATNAVAWLHESSQHVKDSEQRARDLTAEQLWRTHINRAATNKRTGLAWTGLGRRRSRQL